MIIVTAKITTKNGDRDKIISKAGYVIESTRHEPGCIIYDFYASTEDENILMFEMMEESGYIKATHANRTF